MKLMLSMMTMAVLAITGDAFKGMILRKSGGGSWGMFLCIASEIALYQIAASLYLGILSGYLDEMKVPIGISAAVLIMILISSFINEEDGEAETVFTDKTNNGREADLTGRIFADENGYEVYVNEGTSMHWYTIENQEDLRFRICNEYGHEIASAYRLFDSDDTFLITPAICPPEDLLTRYISETAGNISDMVSAWYEDDMRRIEVAYKGQIILTIRFYDDAFGEECRIWLKG